jgi:hypothetical protein
MLGGFYLSMKVAFAQIRLEISFPSVDCCLTNKSRIAAGVWGTERPVLALALILCFAGGEESFFDLV